jgi:hypothetical protein
MPLQLQSDGPPPNPSPLPPLPSPPSSSLRLLPPPAPINTLQLPSPPRPTISTTAADAAAAATPAAPAAAIAADVATSTSSSSFSVLQKDTDALWTAASQLVQGGVESLSCKFLPAQQLQQKVTEALESHLNEQTHTALSPDQQTIVTSLSSVDHSGAFLSVLPVDRAYRVTDEQMRLAIRSRLGMLPAMSLRKAEQISTIS